MRAGRGIVPPFAHFFAAGRYRRGTPVVLCGNDSGDGYSNLDPGGLSPALRNRLAGGQRAFAISGRSAGGVGGGTGRVATEARVFADKSARVTRSGTGTAPLRLRG